MTTTISSGKPMTFTLEVSEGLARRMATEGGWEKFLRQNRFSKAIQWMIDSKYRRIVSLEKWLREATVADPVAIANLTNLQRQVVARTGDWKEHEYDKLVVIALQEVQKFCMYLPDDVTWSMPEYWQTPEETLKSRTGDCEDGAILLYYLCRQLGVPSGRLWLWAGDVRNPYREGTFSGHCALFYVPDRFPLNMVCLDWCYEFDHRMIDRDHSTTGYGRTIYSLLDKIVFAHGGRERENIYERTWFLWNENASYTAVRLSVDYDA